MSKGGDKHRDDARRAARRVAEFASLQQRAAAEQTAARRHEHIVPVDVEGQEEKYEPLLFAIEEGLVDVYEERKHLPIDDEAERALRLLIARFEGDTERRAGNADVDAMAARVNRHIELLFRRVPLLSRAEIIGCLRRIISSIHTWHAPENPRAYFERVREFTRARAQLQPPPGASSLWAPGQAPSGGTENRPSEPRTTSGIWLPGDRG